MSRSKFSSLLASSFFTALCLGLGAATAEPAPVGGAPVNPAEVSSPWPSYHGGPARQASTRARGPVSRTPDVTLSYFEDAADEQFGASPWHLLGDNRYEDSPTARALWGVSLKYLYKYIVDGDEFRFVDSFQLNYLSFFVGWNFSALADGRILVPNPNGLRVGGRGTRQCRGRHPSLLVFRDGATSDSGIECVKKFEFSPAVIESACGFRNVVFGTTAIWTNVLFSGDISTVLFRDVGRGDDKTRESWIAILNNDLTRIKTCVKAAEGGQTNGSPMERGPNGETIFYVPTETEIVAMQYDPRANELTRIGSTRTDYRARTGTTPTLLGFDGEDEWIITIDGRCAVTSVFSGAIGCDESDQSPSALVAAPRPLGSGPAIRHPLPDYIDTVENSPAVAGNDIVVANYSGYTPDGEKDGERDFARGIVKLSWNPATRSFQTDWEHRDIQVSCIPTISASANRVYGDGAEEDGFTYFYAFRLNDDAEGEAGELVTRVRVGKAPFRGRGGSRTVFDAGNGMVINDDGSAIWPGGEVLVRIRDRAAAPAEPAR